MKQVVTVLGATGSIGASTLDILSRHPGKYEVFALSAHKNVSKLVELALTCQPRYLVVASQVEQKAVLELLNHTSLRCDVLYGAQALCSIASESEVDIVMAAIVGAAGLLPTMAAVKAGKRVLLANKESLVMSGQLFIDAVDKHRATLLPVDSEHNAIFQSLPQDFCYGDLASSGISKVLLTGSGGPFLDYPMSGLSDVTPEQACAHPNWSMGQKISVDSATMMNKGLEYIEACWLFGLTAQDIDVVLHPQSVIHSMVQYVDGSVLAQMGNPDMRTPIAHCLAYPERIDAGVAPLDFSQLNNFSFTTPDFQRYPNLLLAMEAFDQGQWATTALNAANEVSVEAFLQKRIRFTDIAALNADMLNSLTPSTINQLEDVIELDKQVRMEAEQALMRLVA